MRDLLFTVRFLLALSWRTDRRRLLQGGSLLVLGSAATPVVALALKHLVDAVVAGDVTRACLAGAVAGVALIAELQLGHFAHLAYFELAELNEARLNSDLLRLVNGTDGLELLDSPGFADRLSLLRQDVARMRECVTAVLQLCGLLVQAVLTAVILAQIQAALLLLPVAAVVPVLLSRRAERVVRRAREETAPAVRRIGQLRRLATDPTSMKEVRLGGGADFLLSRRAELHASVRSALRRAQVRSALVRSLGQVVFAAAYAGAVVLVLRLVLTGRASSGDVVLLLALATQITVQLAAGVQQLASLHVATEGFRQMQELRDGLAARATLPPLGTGVLRAGLDLEGVGFRYPGGDRDVLQDLTLHLPPGTSVALVGENGAGKSTLVKLLTGLYRPTSGRVLVDGTDVHEVEMRSWRERTATLFQDFAQLQLTAQQSVGVGRVADVDSTPAVEGAVARARAQLLVDALPAGLETELGRHGGAGHDLSGGQWQAVGLSRTLMRTEPLLLTLDEPGHSLDALTEERMFEAYQAASDVAKHAVGGITVFVTHRLAMVRQADVILVLEAGRLVESGSHDELVAAGGRYAELFELQAQGYR